MPNSMRAEPFEHTAVISPVQGPVEHVMAGRIVDNARFAETLTAVMNVEKEYTVVTQQIGSIERERPHR